MSKPLASCFIRDTKHLAKTVSRYLEPPDETLAFVLDILLTKLQIERDG